MLIETRGCQAGREDEIWGPFVVERILGHGGMGEVLEVLVRLVNLLRERRYGRGCGRFRSLLAVMLRNELYSAIRRLQHGYRLDCANV